MAKSTLMLTVYVNMQVTGGILIMAESILMEGHL